MSPVSQRRSCLRTILFWAAPLTWLGCSGDGGTDVVLPSLSVSTATDGVELDPDGYTVIIDGSDTESIGVSASVVVERLTDGPHQVQLAGLAPNCSAQGENPQSVTVRSGTTSTVSFSVQCSATSGSIEVATSTNGSVVDPDGFTLLVDANPWGSIMPGGTANVAGVTPGSHSIGLGGLAANCQVDGENPRTITVSGGETVQVPFSVTCADPGPDPGTLTVAAATTGLEPDPDGYGVTIDGGASQPLGINAAITLPNIPASSHQIELIGVALNCTVSGINPRNVTIAAGKTASVAFTVTCSAPSPDAGSLEVTTVTTGSDPDDGYTVIVDGGTAQSIGANATISLANVTAAEHQVRLQGIADNCTVQGANPVRVTVASSGVGRTAFQLTCTARPPQPGTLRVNVTTTGTSQDGSYTVSVDGGPPLALSGGRTIQNLAAGSHSVLLGDVAANCTVSGANPQTVNLTGGQTSTLTFAVSCAATGQSVNLRIQRVWLSQSTQNAEGSVPLVQSRDGFLRVFVTGSPGTPIAPAVRVRLFQSGALLQTLSIPAPGSSTPSTIQEGTLTSSWNVQIPGSLIQPNTSMLVDVDPDNRIAESNENDNTFPASGTTQALSVQAVSPAIVRLVPIRQTANGLVGNVGSADQALDLTRRMYPLGNVSAEVRQVFTVQGPLQPFNDNKEWNQVLSDLDALHIMDDATDRTYYGVVHLDYTSGIVGNGFVGAPTALGWDNPSDMRRVIAHELGHTWGQLHTPCGTPPGVDPAYPYHSGNIGVYGYDLGNGTLKTPGQPDIMGYCDNPWVSDYTYKGIMTYRRSHPLGAQAAEGAQPCILIWGRIVNGQAVLEPTFQIVTRPLMPQSRGPYAIEAKAADGSSLFNLSFDATAAADAGQNSRYFAFAVPLDHATATRLGTVRLTGPGTQLAAVRQSAELLQRGPVQDRITARREMGTIALQWNAALHPMLIVRDPDTGEVLSFARGGNARVWTGKGAVDLEVSNGVLSHRERLAISR
ncbi:MAG: CARDB domain-containing protein [Gemmatimonadales bacterium]